MYLVEVETTWTDDITGEPVRTVGGVVDVEVLGVGDGTCAVKLTESDGDFVVFAGVVQVVASQQEETPNG